MDNEINELRDYYSELELNPSGSFYNVGKISEEEAERLARGAFQLSDKLHELPPMWRRE